MSTTDNPVDPADLREHITERYGAAARAVLASGNASCCGSSPPPLDDGAFAGIYTEGETGSLPSGAAAASLGCGNPTALAELHEGEVVLDLGSGGGIDVLLSARRVGPAGKAYGLDMTDDMLELARRNQAEAGVENVEFLKGEIESIPLPDDSVDVIISNCVINLSADKNRVFAEAFRVLRPGGRIAVSDIVVQGELAPEIRRDIDLWSSCIAGALSDDEYRSGLEGAGFTDVDIEPTRVLGSPDDGTGGALVSAFVRAVKPAGRAS